MAKKKVPTRPLCPAEGCSEELTQFTWPANQSKGRYWWCECPGSTGEAQPDTQPECNLCTNAMELRRGERSTYKGRWFWSCPDHRETDVDIEPPPGPAAPRRLHEPDPQLGGGWAKRRL